MKDNKMKCKVPERKRQFSRICMELERYGQHNLTVKHLLLPKNFSSEKSVLTIDNTLRDNKESISCFKKLF